MEKQLSIDDCRRCIMLLLDKREDGHTRVAASDGLMYCICQEAKDALYHVLMDQSEPDYLREEVAGSLGSVWAENGIEYDRLINIPPPFLNEIVLNFDTCEIRIDKAKLGEQQEQFQALFKGRKFMV